MEIKKVGVLGCGLMGSGIAQVAATAGFDVTVLDRSRSLSTKALPESGSRWPNLPRSRRKRAASRSAERRDLRPAEGHDRKQKTWPIATS